MGAQHERRGLLGAHVFHDAPPEQARSPKLGDLHIEVHAYPEEEREPPRELVHIHAARQSRLHVLLAVGERERELKCWRRSGLVQVVTGDGDGVESRHVLRRSWSWRPRPCPGECPRTEASCPRPCPRLRLPFPRRLPPAGRRSRSLCALRDRRPPRRRERPRREPHGRKRSTPPPSRTRRTGGSSTDAPCTSLHAALSGRARNPAEYRSTPDPRRPSRCREP